VHHGKTEVTTPICRPVMRCPEPIRPSFLISPASGVYSAFLKSLIWKDPRRGIGRSGGSFGHASTQVTHVALRFRYRPIGSLSRPQAQPPWQCAVCRSPLSVGPTLLSLSCRRSAPRYGDQAAYLPHEHGLTPPLRALVSSPARTPRRHRASGTWLGRRGWTYRAPADARTDQLPWHASPLRSSPGLSGTDQADQPTRPRPCRFHAVQQPTSGDQNQDANRDPWPLRHLRPHTLPQRAIRAAQRPREAPDVGCLSFAQRSTLDIRWTRWS
jgi:hypothetical protein